MNGHVFVNYELDFNLGYLRYSHRIFYLQSKNILLLAGSGIPSMHMSYLGNQSSEYLMMVS